MAYDNRDREYSPREPARTRSAELPDERFEIGTIDGKPWWTNCALEHENGRLTNGRLMTMSDQELKALAFADTKREDGIRTEMYRRPRNGKAAEQQTGFAGDGGKVYSGVHRAHAILQYRQRLDQAAMGKYGPLIDAASDSASIRQIISSAGFDSSIREIINDRIRKFGEARIRTIDEKEAMRALSTAAV